MASYSGTDKKADYVARLRRIEGQVRGLQRMVESDTYCIDVLTQVSAVTRALQAVALGLVEDHLGHCVTQAIEASGPTWTWDEATGQYDLLPLRLPSLKAGDWAAASVVLTSLAGEAPLQPPPD